MISGRSTTMIRVSITLLMIGLTNCIPTDLEHQDGRISHNGMTKQKRMDSRKRISRQYVHDPFIKSSASLATIVTVASPVDDVSTTTSRQRVAAGVALIGAVTLLPHAIGTKAGNLNFEGGILNLTETKFVWVFHISSNSTTTEAIRLHLEDVFLPTNTELVVVSSTQMAAIDGPYQMRGPNNNGQFWTRSLSGSYLTLVIRSTSSILVNMNDVLRQISFRVAEVAQVSTTVTITSSNTRRTLGGAAADNSADLWPCQNNGECFVDPQCAANRVGAASSSIAVTMKAVAKLEWVDSKTKSVFSCTGTLLATQDPSSQKNLMMTANHCFNKARSEDFESIEAYFFYSTDKCKGTCPGNLLNGQPRPVADTVGANLLSYDETLDYALIQLVENGNSYVPQGVAYLGWDSSLTAKKGQKLYRISTPNFGAQVYSEHKVNVQTNNLCGHNPKKIITTNGIKGGTATGSSGSPIVDATGNFLGHLMGKCGNTVTMCSTDVAYATLDSAFSSYFPLIKKFLVVDKNKNGTAGA